MITTESLETRIADFQAQIATDEVLKAEYESLIRSTQALYVETNSRLERNKRSSGNLSTILNALSESFELPIPEQIPIPEGETPE